MYWKIYISSVSSKILILTLGIYLLDFIMGGKFYSLFALQPHAIVEDLELWRIFTYPLAKGSIEGIVLFALTFLVFAPWTEKFLNKYLFLLLFSLLICLQGTVTTLVFWNSQVFFAGMEGISFYVIILFALLNLDKKVLIRDMKPIASLFFVLFLFTSWLISIVMHSMIGNNKEILISGSMNLLFGITCGLITFLQIKISRRFLQNSKNELSELEIPGPDELSPALITNKEWKNFKKNLEDEINYRNGNYNLSEDRLNEILDKINDSGKESLSDDEIKFLDIYSKNL